MGGPAKRDVILEIENSRIKGLFDSQFYNVDQNDIVDFSSSTIIPGLIDSHIHLCLSGTNDQKTRQMQLKAVFDDAKCVISANLDQLLLYGVIAVRDGGDYGEHTLRYKKEGLDKKKRAIEIKAAGRAWRDHGRYGKLIGRPPFKGKTLAESILAENKDPDLAKPDHIKIVNSGLNSLKEFGRETCPQFSLDELKDAVNAAASLGLKVMVHANGRLPVETAIDAGCASVEHGFFMGEKNLAKMAEKNITWVPTACTMKAYSECLSQESLEAEISKKTLKDQIRQLVTAREFGVPVAVGTDSGSLGVYHGSSMIEELKLFRQAGFTSEKAVKSSVLNGAAIIGLNEKGPVIKKNKASFIVAAGSPASFPENLNRIQAVYTDGRWIKAPE